MKRSPAIARVASYLTDLLTDPEAFRGQQVRGGGPVAEFEALLAERCGFPYCVATCNATTALMGLALALHARGRTVWFPKSHWEGSVSAMRIMGARIRRYDPHGTEQFRRGDRNFIVVVPEVADVEPIRQWLGAPSCTIIEDSSHLPGWTTGFVDISTADIQVLSFGPGKPMSLGEGGAILFRSDSLWRQFIKHAMHPERTAAMRETSPRMPSEALNARIHPVSAILGIGMLNRSPDAGKSPSC